MVDFVLVGKRMSVGRGVTIGALFAPSAPVSVVDGAQDANVKASTRPPRMNHIVFIERHNHPLGSFQLYTCPLRVYKCRLLEMNHLFHLEGASAHAGEACGSASGRK